MGDLQVQSHYSGVLRKPASRFFFLDADQETQGEPDNLNPDKKETPDKPELKFSQDDVNRLIQERLARQKTSITTELLQELGVETTDAAKRLIQAANESERANQTELERTQKDLERINNELVQANERATKAENDLRLSKRDRVIQDQLTQAGALNSNMVLTVLLANGDYLKEGEPDQDAIKTAIEALKKDQAYLFGKPGGEYRGLGSSKDKVNPGSGDEKAQAAYQKLASQVFGGRA